MYGLDQSASNFQFLVGKELSQLCIGLHQLILNFTEGLVISAECILHLKKADGSKVEIFCNDPNLSKQLVCLLGSTIENVKSSNSNVGELALVFSNGCQLVVIDSNEDYESFIITMPKQEIII